MTFHQMLKNASFYFRMLNSHLLLRPIPNWAAISISSIFKRESWGSPSLQNYILCLLYFRWESEAGQQRATCPIDISNWLGHSTSATEGQQKVQQSPCCYWGFAVPAPPHQDSKLISRWQGDSEEAETQLVDPFQSKPFYNSMILVFLDLMHGTVLFNVCKARPNCCFEGTRKAALGPAACASCKDVIFKACKLASVVSRHR